MIRTHILILLVLSLFVFVAVCDADLPSEEPDATIEENAGDDLGEVHADEEPVEPEPVEPEPETPEPEEPKPEEPEDDPFTLSVSGEKTWTIRMGLGDRLALTPRGLTPGVPVLDQTLRAEITGTALDIITLEASFNDQLGPGFQNLVVRLDSPPWHGELGDFVMGAEGLGVYNKKLLGGRLTYVGEGYEATVLAAREQGISESRTFRSQVASGAATFTLRDPDRPWEPAPYSQHLEGRHYFRLRQPFVEGFSEITIAFSVADGLRALLAEHGLDYLFEDLEETPERPVSDGETRVLADDGDVLLLNADPPTLLRRRIREAIEAYNTRHGLEDDERERYPFVVDSELERAFLTELKRFASLQVDEEAYALDQTERRRYLPLGERDIIEGSLRLELRLHDEEEFRPIEDPEFAAYAWKVFRPEGVLRIDFPDAFFQEGAALRAEFEYRREGNVFNLGLSVVPGSEQVYLNNELLARAQDYSIDYEVGVVILFTPLGPADELRIDFERQRGALGAFADYERAFFGFVLSIPEADGLEITMVQAADIGSPGRDARTMPNRHLVGAARMSGDLLGWAYTLDFGASENVFPPWDNRRQAASNRVNVIASSSAFGVDYVLIGHQAGLTVHDGASFTTYDAADGLGGRSVRDLVALPEMLLIATDGGLTLVRLEEPSPFDRVGSWTRVPTGLTFPGSTTHALAQGGGRVFLATDERVASFTSNEAVDTASWETWPLPEGARPTAMAWAEGRLYLGTDIGLFARTENTEDGWERVAAVTAPVRELLWAAGTLHVATEGGVRLIRDGRGAGWVALGADVHGLAYHEGRLWYGTPRGLFAEDDPEPAVEAAFTSLGAVEQALWGGAHGDAAYEIDLWRLSEEPRRFGQDVTRIDGEDPSSYTDIPAAEHTTRGLSSGLTLTRESDNWTWAIDLGSRGPGFQEIGRFDRSDSHGLGARVTYHGVEQLKAQAGLHLSLVDLWSFPSHLLSGTLNLSWSPGPTYALSLSPTLRGRQGAAFASFDGGYRLSASWPGTTVWGALTLSGRATLPARSTSGQIEGTLNLVPAEGWSLVARATRPYSTIRATGTQGLSLLLTWSASNDTLSWRASWDEQIRNRLGTPAWTFERTLKANLNWAPIGLGETRLTPTLSAEWRQSATEQRLQGQLGTNIKTGPSEWQLGMSLRQGYRPATDRRDRTLAPSLRWEYTAWPQLRPSLRWQGSMEALAHPVYGERITMTHELMARLSWLPAEGWRNELTLTYRSREPSWELRNRLTAPSPIGTINSEATLTWRNNRLQGDVTAGAGWTLGDMWHISGNLGYGMVLTAGDAFRQAVHAAITLKASF